MQSKLRAFTSLGLIFSLILAVFPFNINLARAEDLTVNVTSPDDGASFDIGESINFSSSFGGGVAPFGFVWDFGDDTSALSQNYSKTYSEAGSYTATITVTDALENQATASVDVTINGAEEEDNEEEDNGTFEVSITAPANNSEHNVGSAINFNASFTGGVAPFGFVWNFGDSTSGLSQSYSKTYNTAGTYPVTITVTDALEHQTTDTVNVVIVNQNGGGNGNTPTVDIKINGQDSSVMIEEGNTATATWTSSNADNCSATGNWSGSRPLSGSETIPNYLTPGEYLYTMTCFNSQGNTQDMVTLVVTGGNNGGGNGGNGGNNDALTISNIQVSDVTSTSAVISWTTNLPSTSRVIYDTTSHSSIGDAPNYGYANSTGTQDTSPKVTSHQVTVSGLSPSTTYYFRVISEK